MARQRGTPGGGAGRGRGRRRRGSTLPTHYIWYYRCTYFDATTGAEIGTNFVSTVETTVTNFQRASAHARRLSQAMWRESNSPAHGPDTAYRVSCRRVGSIVAVEPPESP